MSYPYLIGTNRATNKAKTFSKYMKKILLKKDQITPQELAVLKNYRDEFAWVDSIVFSEYFEDMLMDRAIQDRPKLVLVK